MKRLLLLAALAFAPVAALAQIDGSGTITTGGASQVVFPAGGGTRIYLFCMNPIAATEPLYINAPTVAGKTNGSYELQPGGSITFDASFVPQGQVSVLADTTGHRFICKRG